jgi:hypothetical protein
MQPDVLTAIASGAYLALEKTIAALLARRQKACKPAESSHSHLKQAFIVDAHSLDRSYIVIIAGLLASAASIFYGLTGKFFLSQMALITAGIGTGFDMLFFSVRSGTGKLASSLQHKGYSVTTAYNFDSDMRNTIMAIKENAQPAGTSILVYRGHGWQKDNGSAAWKGMRKEIWKMLASSFREGDPASHSSYLIHGKFETYDRWLVENLCEIPGNVILIVDTCKAGGFAHAAASLPSDKSAKLAVLTSSRGKPIWQSNRMVNKFIRFVKSEPEMGISEFFHRHCEERSRRVASAIRNPQYNPQMFVGKKIAALRL